MATKATKGRLVQLLFVVSGSTISSIFSNVRNWNLRFEREVIDATNNDSVAWRELVLPSSTTIAGADDAGQMGGTLTAEAVFDLNPLGPGGVAGRSQAYDRKQVMRHLIDGQPLNTLTLRLGPNPASTSASASGTWATLSDQLDPGGFVESVEVGGSYDAPVLYNIAFRYTGRIGGI
jgi:hypothetical protein